jgi:hypothetical protein
MNTPIICPHCHSLIDPLTLETAVSSTARYQVCPECDRPIILLADRTDESPAPQTEIQLAQAA